VTAAVNRYKSQVTHYEIWNEPNLAQFFEGTPQDYLTSVFNPGADAVHAACPTCKVVGPALATVGTAYATWMDAVLSASASKIDIVSGHVYASFPDLSSGVGTTADSFYNKLEKHRLVQVGGVTVYEGPLSFKEEMDKYAVTKPFWITETGLEAAAGDATAEANQVTYYRDVLSGMLSRPWWQTTIFYESFDEPGQPYHWGVVVHQPSAGKTYTPKPVFSLLSQVGSGMDAGLSADGGAADGGSSSDGGGESGGSSSDGGPGGGGSGDASSGDGNGESGGSSSGSSGGCAITSTRDAGGGALIMALPIIAAGLRVSRRRSKTRC